jgi:endonuclease-3
MARGHAGRASFTEGLVGAVARLSELYPSERSAGPTTPFEIILWKNIGYLIDDDRRAALFSEFNKRVGTNAASIAAAAPAVLLDIAKRGGMRPEARVEKWRQIAALALERAGGDLNSALGELPAVKAALLLKAFPSIGAPGADEILLLSGLDARPAIDSNGLRAMLRLGFCKERTTYSASYREATAALREQGKPEGEWLARAFRVLRAHGQILCKRSAPKCVACPLAAPCPRINPKGSY